MVELSSLYELLERFNRTNQLPAFLVGVVTTVIVGVSVSRVLRLRIGPAARLYEKIDSLHEEIKTLNLEKDRIQSALHHAEKSAEAARSLSNELKGRIESSEATIAALNGACERWKDKAMEIAAKARALWDRHAKMRRLNENMQVQLDVVAKGNGRVWEAPAAQSAHPFRPLSRRHAPIVSLLNLKGGVGKTTIAANMAIATAHLGWRLCWSIWIIKARSRSSCFPTARCRNCLARAVSFTRPWAIRITVWLDFERLWFDRTLLTMARCRWLGQTKSSSISRRRWRTAGPCS